jgi:hypothetical protein
MRPLGGDVLIEGKAPGTQAQSRFFAMPVARASHVYLGVAWAVFLGLVAFFMRDLGSTVVDDAYVALTYARNLAEGEGLVWADGERVEGYTDFLWVLIGAGAFKLNIDPILAYRMTGIAAGIGLIGAVWAWNQRYSIAPPRAQVAPLMLAAMGPIAYWAIAGLETTTYAALAFAATFAGVTGGRYTIVAGVLFFLAALAHPDVVILILPVAGYAALKGHANGQWRDFLQLLLVFGVPFALYWLARWVYFGYPFPNTFYAKSTFSWQHLEDGLLYIRAFAPIASVFAVYVIARGMTKGLQVKPEATVLAGQLGLWLLYVVFVGGDFMEMYRFLIPVLPAFTLLLQDSAWMVASQARFRRTAFALSGALIVLTSLMWFGTWTNWSGRLNYDGFRVHVSEQWRNMGLWLRTHSAPTDVVAVSAAGAIPYFSERSSIDMLGINDIHIAHDGAISETSPPGHKRHDAAYVLDREPDFIVLNNIEEQGQVLPVEGPSLTANGIRLSELPSNVALFKDERFWRRYTRVTLSGLDSHHVVVVRNDRLPRLISSGAVRPVAVD